MKAFVLGTGGMMPLPNRHLTSVLLRRGGELFLFDCGEGTQVSLRSLNLRWKKISAVFVSHTHADHVTGLPGILMLSSQVARTEPLYIIGPPKIEAYVESTWKVLEMYIDFEIKIEQIKNPAQPQTVYHGDGFSVRSFPLDHTRTCVGYVLEENMRPGEFFPEIATEKRVPQGKLWSELQNGNTVKSETGKLVEPKDVMGPPRLGRKFSYMTDTLFHSYMAKEVNDSDLLICEGMFERELEETSHEKKHMTADEAGRLAAMAGGVEKMGMVHFSPRYANHQLKKLEKEAQRHFENAFAAHDKQTIDIPYRE